MRGLRRFFSYFLSVLLVCEALLPSLASARYNPPLSSVTPEGESLFGIPEKYFNQSPESLPQEYKNKIAEQVGLITSSGMRTFLESLFLIQGLYKKVKDYESKYGMESLVQRVSEKRDMTSLDFDYANLGVAELKAIGYGEEQRLITTVRHNSGHYFMFVDRAQFDIDELEKTPDERNDEKAFLEELELRKTLSGVLRLIASKMLLMGDRSHLYIPLSGDGSAESTKKLQQQIKSQVDQELDPLALRYQRIERRLNYNGLNQEQKENLEAEKRILERELLKKLNQRQNILSKIVQYAIMDLGSAVKVQGYEVTVVMHNDGTFIDSVSTETTPQKNSLKYWKKYWESIYESPHVRGDLLKNKNWIKKLQFFTKGDLALSLASTSAQISLSLLTAGVGAWMGIPGPDPSILALNSLFWGLGIGIIIKTFVNWNQTGSKMSRSIKNTATGVGFGYTQFLLESLFGVGQGMQLGDHAKLWATQLLKGPVKVGTQEIPKFRKKTGESSGNLIIRGYDTEIRKVDFETQVIQLILFVPKLASIFLPYGLGIPVYMMMGPLGKLIHLSQVEKYAKDYESEHGAEKPKSAVYRKEAVNLREEWESLKLWDRQWLDGQVNQFDQRVDYWCELIEERSLISGVSRFRVRLNKTIGGLISSSSRKVITVLEFTLSRFPAYYIVPLFSTLKSWKSQITVERVKGFPQEVENYIKAKGAVWVYRAYRSIEKRRGFFTPFKKADKNSAESAVSPLFCRPLFNG